MYPQYLSSLFIFSSFAKIIFDLSYILDKSGEGIVLHKPNSLYTHGISENILKIKVILFILNIILWIIIINIINYLGIQR